MLIILATEDYDCYCKVQKAPEDRNIVNDWNQCLNNCKSNKEWNVDNVIKEMAKIGWVLESIEDFVVLQY